jgi:DNA-binding NtrC family response regulator
VKLASEVAARLRIARQLERSMTASPHVLLVAPTGRIASDVSAGLLAAGLRVTLVTSFNAARKALESCPDLLISEVRLGEYNGLHLALRAQIRGIRAIVIGVLDLITQQDAVKFGAVYLEDDCDTTRLHAAVQAAGLSPSGRFGRIHAA